MAQPPQKDWLDIAIDFFFGAAACDGVVALGFLRAASRQINLHWEWSTFAICIFATTLVAGSMATLYREQFWSSYETYSTIPPIEERVSRRARILLWSLFALGCSSLGLLFIR